MEILLWLVGIGAAGAAALLLVNWARRRSTVIDEPAGPAGHEETPSQRMQRDTHWSAGGGGPDAV
jgi:hypothetical protein